MSLLYKHLAPLGTVFFLCFFYISSPVLAASSLFSVENIHVDVRDKNAYSARDKAFDEAQVKAFNALAQRALSAEEFDTMTPPELSSISTLIKDYEVTQEKLSAVRYVGTYTFRFKEREVRNYFSRQGFKYSDVRSEPIMILPFFQGHNGTNLWAHDNIWMSAWARSNMAGGAVSFTVPMGDLQDVRDIGDDQARSYNNQRLQKMLRRYSAKEAVLVVAAPDPSLMRATRPNDIAYGALDINIYRTDQGIPQHVQQIFIAAKTNQTRKSLYDAAVIQVQSLLRKGWKLDSTPQIALASNHLTAHVYFDGLQEWVRIQRSLGRVHGIDKVEIKSITPEYATIKLAYRGEENRLRNALEQADFFLSAPQIYSNFSTSGIQKNRIYDLRRRSIMDRFAAEEQASQSLSSSLSPEQINGAENSSNALESPPVIDQPQTQKQKPYVPQKSKAWWRP